MNKKVIAAGMAMVLASMGLTACGDSGSKEAKDSSDETYTVTMAYIGDKEEDTDRIEKKISFGTSSFKNALSSSIPSPVTLFTRKILSHPAFSIH